MKRNLNLLLFAVMLLVAQACGTKSGTNEAESTAANTAEITAQQVKTDEAALAERRATLEKDRLAREERRRIANEELAKTTPFYTTKDGKIIYNKAEVDPKYVGGEKALMEYLRNNLQYPKEADDKGLEGTVFVDFVVAADGTVGVVEIMNEPGEEVDESLRNEAIRVVSAMPKWEPGRQRGKAVDVKYSLPITFQMI